MRQMRMRRLSSDKETGQKRYAHYWKLSPGTLFWMESFKKYAMLLEREERKVRTEEGTMYVYRLREATADEVAEHEARIAAEKARQDALTVDEGIAEDMATAKAAMPDLDWGD